MNASIIKQLIESGLPDSDVVVEGDDGTHFNAYIVSESFIGEQHKMVYKALGDKIGKEIHALSFKTFTPHEFKNNKLN